METHNASIVMEGEVALQTPPFPTFLSSTRCFKTWVFCLTAKWGAKHSLLGIKSGGHMDYMAPLPTTELSMAEISGAAWCSRAIGPD